MRVQDKKYLQISVRLANKSVKNGVLPAGALVVRDDKILSEGVSLEVLND